MKFLAYIRLLRPHHYIKNLFVLTPLFFSFKFDDPALLLKALGVFGLYSLTASAVYIFNDLMDVAEDRLHPVKKNRPLASGAVSPVTAVILSLILGTTALIIGYMLDNTLGIILSVYAGMNVLYSVRLKHFPIIDLIIISIGFVLRVLAGAVVIAVPTTMWIVLMTFLLSLFLGLAKRRDDVLLSADGTKTRKSTDGYNLEFINGGMIMMASVVIVVYIFYATSPEVTQRFHSNQLIYTVIFVIIGILRYLKLTFVDNKSGNPTRLLWNDRVLQFTILIWAGSFWFIVKMLEKVMP